MAQIAVNYAGNTSQLWEMLNAEDIEPGDEPSYQMCKTLFSYHPFGQKMAKAPVDLAQSQEREITCPAGPEERIVKAFKDEWKRLEADRLINNTRTLSRVYGIASLAVMVQGLAATTAMDYWNLYKQTISFNVLDPLNTAGSLVLNQNPNSPDFMKWDAISIAGSPYNRNRSVTIMNEEPMYIQWTNSAYGFVGRSVYQRALFPMKSFLGTMVTDDMISRKAGLLIAKVKQPGSVIDNVMAFIGGVKRNLVNDGATNQTLQIATDEEIESLNLQNIDGAGGFARRNIVTNIATSADMPAVFLLNESLTEGFGEGSEDAKQIARYVDGERIKMNPLYDFMTRICQHRAWNPDLFAIIQKDYPAEYGKMDYKEAFYRWQNSFSATWPNLLAEPDSEKIKTQDVVFKAALAIVELAMALGEPNAVQEAFSFLADTVNANKLLFPEPLELDYDKILAFLEENRAMAQESHVAGMQGDDQDNSQTKPGSRTMERADSARASYDDSLKRMLDSLAARQRKRIKVV
jgi:hypothetical protein